eukprot:COSAG01_NODE_2774_length_7098_cov_13.905571_8_plen_271_part_00
MEEPEADEYASDDFESDSDGERGEEGAQGLRGEPPEGGGGEGEEWCQAEAEGHDEIIVAVCPVSRPFPSWDRSTLTEIYLCHACSCQEILRTETAGQVGAKPGSLLTLTMEDGEEIEARLPAGVMAGDEFEVHVRGGAGGLLIGGDGSAAEHAPEHDGPAAAAAAVSRLCVCIGSPCLRHCVHGASIIGSSRTAATTRQGWQGSRWRGGACAAASYLLGSAGAASTGRAGAVGAAGAGSSIHRPGGGGPALCVALGAAAAPAGRFRAGRA